ncbi:MAG: acylphosphatase [Candidatus Thermoplasmatota archaeon]|jgi:acylphosphatase|nr:acylphosphatase [Candidatus Thermoplasmatota archaeon]MCL5963246.1 acylphosphatase [Candidatus Thermoplasmatota archaeon]
MHNEAEVIFSGNVQGVNFRSYAKKKADQLGVYGIIENLENGNVHAILQGEKENIVNLINYLMHEHPYATVETVDIKWVPEESKDIVREFRIIK